MTITALIALVVRASRLTILTGLHQIVLAAEGAAAVPAFRDGSGHAFSFLVKNNEYVYTLLTTGYIL